MKRIITSIGKSSLKVFLVALLSFTAFVLKAENEPNNTSLTSNTIQLSVLNSGVVDNSADKIDWWVLSETNGVYKVRFKTDKKVTFTLYGNNPAKSLTSFTLSNVLDTTFTFPYTGAQYIKVSGATEIEGYESFLGKNCLKFTWGTTKFLQYKGIPLKSQVSTLGVNYTETATSFETNVIVPATKFEIPTGVKFEDMGEMMDMLQNGTN